MKHRNWTVADVMTQVAKFNTLATATEYMWRAQGRAVLRGNDGLYWVTMQGWAQWLLKNVEGVTLEY